MKNSVIPIFGSGMHGVVDTGLVFVLEDNSKAGMWGKILPVADFKFVVTKINDINSVLFVGNHQNPTKIKN